MPGFKFLVRHDHNLSFVEWSFWFLSCICALALSAYLIAKEMIFWTNSPVTITFDSQETPIWKIPFPAVTVCNMNAISVEQANEISRNLMIAGEYKNLTLDLQLKATLMEYMCMEKHNIKDFLLANVTSSNATFFEDHPDVSEEEVKESILMMAQPCSSLLSECKLRNLAKNGNCEQLFQEIVTEFGLCCTFNLLPDVTNKTMIRDHDEDWSLEGGYKFGLTFVQGENADHQEIPYRTDVAGYRGALSFTLDLQESQYTCPQHKSTGFKILLHPPISTPEIMSYGYPIGPGHEYFISVEPVIIEGEGDLIQVVHEKRSCFFQEEKPLAYYKYYSESNCAAECRANVSVSHCGCLPHYMPGNRMNGSHKIPICGPSTRDCTDEALLDHYEQVYKDIHDILSECNLKDVSQLSAKDQSVLCECEAGCTEMRYTSTVTNSPLSPKNTPNFTYAKENLAVVNIFYYRQSFMSRHRNQLYSAMDFFASIGGLLGLCVGVSAIGMVEFLYYFCVRPISKYFRRKHLH